MFFKKCILKIVSRLKSKGGKKNEQNECFLGAYAAAVFLLFSVQNLFFAQI
jgi:hypothetical protein